MRHPFGIILGLGLTWLAYTLFREAGDAYNAEAVDPTRVVVLFGEVILVGLATGIVFVTTFMPAVAEWVGNFFFNPDEEIENATHGKALAACARGDYATAIREYEKAWKKDPSDTDALQEISQLYCEKLNNPESAVKVLEAALARGSTDEMAAMINALLAEVYWRHLHNVARAREILHQIIDAMPHSKHSMNAERRLQEMERELIRETAG
jgi:tetratricopeptide (TPR) repeat protein